MSAKSDFDSMVLNVIDGLLFGIPSAVLIPEVQQKYDVETQVLTQLYNQLSKEFNNLSMQISDGAMIKSELMNDLHSMSPLGNWYLKFKDRIDKIDASNKTAEDRYRRVNEDMQKVSDRLSELDLINKRSSNLSGAIDQGAKQLLGED